MSSRKRALPSEDEQDSSLVPFPQFSLCSDYGGAFRYYEELTRIESSHHPTGSPKAIIPGSTYTEEQFAKLPAAEQKKQRRLIRNRLSAQLHRVRQRAHVDAMETQVTELSVVVKELISRAASLASTHPQLFPHAILSYVPPSLPGILGYTGDTERRVGAITASVYSGLLGGAHPFSQASGVSVTNFSKAKDSFGAEKGMEGVEGGKLGDAKTSTRARLSAESSDGVRVSLDGVSGGAAASSAKGTKRGTGRGDRVDDAVGIEDFENFDGEDSKDLGGDAGESSSWLEGEADVGSPREKMIHHQSRNNSASETQQAQAAAPVVVSGEGGRLISGGPLFLRQPPSLALKSYHTYMSENGGGTGDDPAVVSIISPHVSANGVGADGAGGGVRVAGLVNGSEMAALQGLKQLSYNSDSGAGILPNSTPLAWGLSHHNPAGGGGGILGPGGVGVSGLLSLPPLRPVGSFGLEPFENSPLPSLRSSLTLPSTKSFSAEISV